MPTLFENIAYFWKQVIVANRSVIKHIAKSMLAIFVIALLLETFVFNFNYFSSMNLNTIDMRDEIDLPMDPNEEYRLTSFDHEVEFYNLNTEIKNIRIDFPTDQPAQNVEFSIHFTDEAHKTYFDSTEYTIGVPDVIVSTASVQSQYINLNTTGLVGNLKLEVVNDDVQFPILLHTIEINAHHPFDFNMIRFSIALTILILIFMFRPRSAIYRISIVENPKLSKAGIVSALIIECLLISTFLFYGSNLVGVATSYYNYGSWDGVSIVNTFEVGGDNAQQYAELARSMSQGRLYLEEEPPDWLKDMSDPYDKGARDELQKATGEQYLWDTAYKDGHYYVYFGVVPVVLFYLPFYVLTGGDFPTAIGVLIAVIMFVIGISALLDRFARYHFKKVSLGLYLLLQIALVSSCGILYLIKFSTFYSLPIACALAFTAFGLYFWMRGRDSRHRCICFAIGSLCMALVAGCRPQLLLMSLLAFPLFWRPYIKDRRLFTRKGLREFLCLIMPYVFVAIAIMLYNYARFDSFFDFGANYNLTVNDMTKRGWNVGRIAPALFAYFLQPPDVVGVFPFLKPVEFETTYLGQTIKEATFGGIFVCIPLLWVLFFTRPIVKIRNAQRSSNTITGVITVLVLSGILIAILDAEMAGILQRYYADFSFMFLSAAMLLVFIVNENLADVPAKERAYRRSKGDRHHGHGRLSAKLGAKLSGRSKDEALEDRIVKREQILQERSGYEQYSKLISPQLTRSLLTKVLIVIVTIGVVYSVLLCIVPETGWYSDVYPWAYHDLLETVLFWT